MTNTDDFVEFPKIARLNRECIITEKLDGMNVQIVVAPDGSIRVGTRTQWVTPEADMYSFAAWARDHEDELRQLGPGRHFGEWWGLGVRCSYGLKEKRLSFFNTLRWVMPGTEPGPKQKVLPACVGLVPVLWRGDFDSHVVNQQIQKLIATGSVAAPGWMKPKGVVVFHVAANVAFKVTCTNDHKPKGGE